MIKWMIKIKTNRDNNVLLPAYGMHKTRAEGRKYLNERFPRGCKQRKLRPMTVVKVILKYTEI